MTIAKRLIILLAVPLVALLGLGVFTRLQLSKVEDRSQFVARTQIPSLAALGNVSRHFEELRVDIRNCLLSTDQEGQRKARSAFDATEAEVTRLLREYGDQWISDEKDRRLLNDFQVSYHDWLDRARQVAKLAADGRREDAATILLTDPMVAIGVRLSRPSDAKI